MLAYACSSEVVCSLHVMRTSLTRNDIARIQSILVLDEAEPIHELDLGNLAGAMAVEVVLNIGLGC